MKDYLDDLAAFLGERADSGRRLDLLVRAVSNLIDEVMILRSVVQDIGGIDEERWRKMYGDMKMNALFSRQGDAPTRVFKYRRFFMDARETAESLIPDEARRNEVIEGLGK